MSLEHTFDMPCECGQQLLRLSWEDGDPDVSLAVWAWRGGAPDWRHRVRMILRIVKVGYPYEDDTILDRTEAARLVVALQQFLKRPADPPG